MKEIFNFIYDYYRFYVIAFAGVGGLGIYCFFTRKSRKADLILYIVKLFCIIASWCMSLALYNKTKLFLLNVENSYIIQFILKCLVSFVVGIISYPLIVYVGKKMKEMANIKCWISRNKWGVAIFIYFLCSLIVQLPKAVAYWGSVWYACDYSIGIGSRFFIGEVMSLFYDDFLDERLVFRFVVIALIVIIGLVSYFLNKILIEFKENAAIVYLTLIFLVMPGSIPSMWQQENFGRLEMYGLLLALLSIVVFTGIQNIYLKYTIVTLFSLMSMAIYHGNAFMYYPIILMLFTYEGLDVTLNKLKQRRIFGLCSVVLTMFSFFFFQFGKSVRYESASEVMAYLNIKTNMAMSEAAVDYELFQPMSKAFENLNLDFLRTEFPREKAFLTLLLILPIIIIVYVIYSKCRLLRIANNKRVLACPYIYYVLFAAMIIPQFVLNVDWGRWMTSNCIMWFAGIFYLIYKKDKYMIMTMTECSVWVRKNMLISIFVLLFIAGLSKFMGREFISEANNLLYLIY